MELLADQPHVLRALAGMDYIKDSDALLSDFVDYPIAPYYPVVDVPEVLFHKRITGIFVGDKTKAVALFLDLGSYLGCLFLGFSLLDVIVDPPK